MTQAGKTPVLRLPRKLAYTAARCAIAGVLACSGHGEERPDAAVDAAAGDVAASDGSQDAASDVTVYDAQPDCGDAGPPTFCGPNVPSCNDWVCGFDCAPGCAPYI